MALQPETRQAHPLRPLDAEARLFDGLLGAAVGVAAGADPAPDRGDHVLHAPPEAALVVADVLPEAEGALRLEDATRLRQSPELVGHRAEHQAADDVVEGGVFKREPVSGGLTQLD